MYFLISIFDVASRQRLGETLGRAGAETVAAEAQHAQGEGLLLIGIQIILMIVIILILILLLIIMAIILILPVITMIVARQMITRGQPQRG